MRLFLYLARVESARSIWLKTSGSARVAIKLLLTEIARILIVCAVSNRKPATSALNHASPDALRVAHFQR